MENEKEAKAMAEGKKEGDRQLGSRQLLPAVFIIISLVWIYIGMTQFGFWNPLRGGTPAFMPICIATVLLISSSVMLLMSFKDEKPAYTPLCFLFLLICLSIIGLSAVFGFLPSLLLFVLLWLKLVEKAPWKGTLIVFASLAVLGYGLFEIWLRVPFPKGLLLELLI
ncbi:MAG: tripartite tricarboxylate transporter TctB [Spirochaetae bacterium HGW-Spirochaetae-9]|nr:MAG: tripartite tricarboxylate transporter TctB [Spirochaetae bacterium HGW-Spirochaetae-9]